MSTELRQYHTATELFVRDYSAAWRRTHLVHPSVWFARDPEVEEKMLRDPDIAHAVGLRKEQIAGRQWTVTPVFKNSPRASLAVGVATDLLAGIKRFTSAREALARAFFSGKRYARIKFEPRILRLGDGRARTWIVPVELEDMDQRMYRVENERDAQTGTVRGWRYRWHAGPDQWVKETPDDDLRTIEHRYQDDMTKLGHGSALREALGWVWYAKTHIAQELISAAERYGQGVIRARIDGLADGESGVPNAQRVAQWVSLLENVRGRHVLVHDKKDDIDVVQMSGTGWELLDRLETKYRSSVLTLVLGANLTTAANDGGSYALAEVQENSTESRIQNDREMMEETLTDELLGPVWYYNRANLVELGISDEKPRFSIKQEKRLDPQVRANVASVLAGMGVELSLDDVLEQTGMRRPEQGEPTIKGRMAAPDPMAMLGGMDREFGAGVQQSRISRRPVRFSSDDEEDRVEIVLYRAAADDYISDTASFATDLENAKAYQDNPNFGGENLFKTKVSVEKSKVLDLASINHDKARRKMIKIIGHDPGAIGIDEQVPRSGQDFQDAGYDWVIVPESYPEDTETWVWVGPSDREPRLIAIDDDGNAIDPDDEIDDRQDHGDEGGPGVSRNSDGTFAPGGTGVIKDNR